MIMPLNSYFLHSQAFFYFFQISLTMLYVCRSIFRRYKYTIKFQFTMLRKGKQMDQFYLNHSYKNSQVEEIGLNLAIISKNQHLFKFFNCFRKFFEIQFSFLNNRNRLEDWLSNLKSTLKDFNLIFNFIIENFLYNIFKNVFLQRPWLKRIYFPDFLYFVVKDVIDVVYFTNIYKLNQIGSQCIREESQFCSTGAGKTIILELIQNAEQIQMNDFDYNSINFGMKNYTPNKSIIDGRNIFNFIHRRFNQQYNISESKEKLIILNTISPLSLQNTNWQIRSTTQKCLRNKREPKYKY